VKQVQEEQKVQALPEVKYEVIGQSLDDFAKTRTV
jgi:ribosomal protein S19